MSKIPFQVYNLYWISLKKNILFKDWIERNEEWIRAGFVTVVPQCLDFLEKYLIKKGKK